MKLPVLIFWGVGGGDKRPLTTASPSCVVEYNNTLLSTTNEIASCLTPGTVKFNMIIGLLLPDLSSSSGGLPPDLHHRDSAT